MSCFMMSIFKAWALRRGWWLATMASALALSLAGCGVIPLSSLWALRKLDLMTVDAQQIRVLLYLPAGVEPQPDALLLALKLSRSDAAGAEQRQETLALRPQPEPAAALPAAPMPAAPLPVAPLAGGHWAWLALGEADLRRFEALRSRALAWKASDGTAGGRKLEMNLTPQLCRSGTAPLRVGEVKLSAWLRWEAGQALLPLLESASSRDLGGEAAEKSAAEILPRCGTLAG